MVTIRGPRVCPACHKAGRLLPASKNATNPLLRTYRCQSCHWQGLMFRPIKTQSRLGFYITLLLLIALLFGALLLAFYVLDQLPEK